MTDQFNQHDQSTSHFMQVGMPLLERGFRLTPIDPKTKSPSTANWQLWQVTSIEKLTKEAKYHRDDNVGVYSSRGVGNLIFLDIDAAGVVERIEKETKQRIPETYSVLTRPQTNPAKRHFYFLQTAYSFKKLAFGEKKSKNINVKDLTKLNDKGQHPTVYDVKGCGGGAYVVGAGSYREDTNEVYTAVDPSAEVFPIPDWLVDWIVADVKRFRAEKEEERKKKYEKKYAERRQQRSISESILNEWRKEGRPESFEIYREDLHSFARWRAGQLASLGCSPATIEVALIDVITSSCVGGKEYVETESGRASIHKIAFDKKLNRGNSIRFYEQKDLGVFYEFEDDRMVIHGEPKSRHEVLVEMIAAFTEQTLPASVAYERLAAACVAQGYTLDREINADQQAVVRARRQARVETKNVGGRHVWIRKAPEPPAKEGFPPLEEITTHY
jgi:Bifunctional DNA primase/polymerase, N-terminal